MEPSRTAITLPKPGSSPPSVSESLAQKYAMPPAGWVSQLFCLCICSGLPSPGLSDPASSPRKPLLLSPRPGSLL